MKKIIILSLCALPLLGNAQGLFKRLKDKVTETATNTLVNKAQQIAEKKIDQGTQQTTTAPTMATSANEAPKPVMQNSTVYDHFDFVAGQTIVYEENFDGQAPGELPAGWNTNGSGVIVRLDKFPGNWLHMAQNATYLSANKAATGKDFTVEFDLMSQFKPGSYILPQLAFGMLASGKEAPNNNTLLKEPRGSKSFEVQIHPGYSSHSDAQLHGYKDNSNYFDSAKIRDNSIEAYGDILHVSIAVQGQRIRVWLNSNKVFDVPMAVPAEGNFNQFFFRIGNSNYRKDETDICLSRIRIADGLPDLRTKLLDEGKYSTTGIHFDAKRAEVKSDSYGTLKEIATLLNENPDLKLQITGHTDADGAAKSNQQLSLERALAVKVCLASQFGIDINRLTTKGMGSAQPVASNNSATGKAQNRRVEFAKI